MKQCKVCGDSHYSVEDDMVCLACAMDWEWFMSIRVVDLEQRDDGSWTAPGRNGPRWFVACSTEELRWLIKRQPIGKVGADKGAR